MNRKSILGLLLFGCLVIAGMFYGVTYMIGQEIGADAKQKNTEYVEDDIAEDSGSEDDQYAEGSDQETWLSSNPSDTGEANQVKADTDEEQNEAGTNEVSEANNDKDDTDDDLLKNGQGDEKVVSFEDKNVDKDTGEEVSGTIIVSGIKDQETLEIPERELIRDCTQVDYMAYIPEMVLTSKIETALDIDNPDLNIDAKAAILFDAETKEVLFYKNPVEAVFPASTAKLLTALVALEWCDLDEEIIIGNEIKMIASDSTKAYLHEGDRLTMNDLLEGMLLPSGNDAAYATAAYVGRKSLGKLGATREDAVAEFVRLMKEKAKRLGVVNSSFKTPDGYDAIGQYTTAYDMGLIGLAAAENETIVEICGKSSSYNEFLSGREVTWNTTNSLIKKDSGRYYSGCIGLKTGTSTMAGRCLISVAKRNGKKVVSVVMNSTSTGRWNDSQKLLDYGLD